MELLNNVLSPLAKISPTGTAIFVISALALVVALTALLIVNTVVRNRRGDK